MTKRLHVLLIAAVACAGVARVANANCVEPKPAVLWSYPSAGVDDVPTDAVFWLVVTPWQAQPRITLNGTTLQLSSAPSPAFDAVSVHPGPLAPNSDFVLRVEFDLRTKVDIPFHTASTEKTTPAKPTVRGDRETPGLSPTHACADVIAAQDCFDTGQDGSVEFDIEPSRDALAWLVQTGYGGISTLWPARCGKPLLVGYSSQPGCVDIQAVGEGGMLSEKTRYCMTDDEAEPSRATIDDAFTDSSPDTNTGCSLIGMCANRARAWPYALLALPLLALRARRRLFNDRKPPRA